MKLTPEFLKADGGRMLLNLITSDGITPVADAPAAAQFVPQRRHLVDVLRVVGVGAGTASIPRSVAPLAAGVQSSEGMAGRSNASAELETLRQPFAQIMASVGASRQLLDDGAMVAALIDGQLREALRAAADTELATQLAAYAELHVVAGSSDLLPSIVETVLAFQAQWGAPRALLIDHEALQANAVNLIAGSPGVVSFDADALRICGVPVVACDMPNADQAIITSAVILQREAEAVVSSRMHSDNFIKNRVTLMATARLAAVGPSLRVAV